MEPQPLPLPMRRTPVLTVHARARCEEMAISTKVAKRILRSGRVTTYPANRDARGGRYAHPEDARAAVAPEEPGYAAVYVERPDGTLVVLTVLFNTRDEYVRDGVTYRPVNSDGSPR